MDNIAVFLPCRLGSQRVPEKNIRPISDFEFGLIEIKIKQLINVNKVSSIVVSSNDPTIINFLQNNSFDKVIIDRREDSLCTSSTSTDSLIEYLPSIINSEHIMWTHVTSPFITSNLYNKLIDKYFSSIDDGFDSLLSVTPIQNFLWDNNAPTNYNRDIEKWPRTQTLKKLYEVNSGCFISTNYNYINLNDRIGNFPYLFELDKIQSIDVDWPDDFDLVKTLIECNAVELF